MLLANVQPYLFVHLIGNSFPRHGVQKEKNDNLNHAHNNENNCRSNHRI